MLYSGRGESNELISCKPKADPNLHRVFILKPEPTPLFKTLDPNQSYLDRVKSKIRRIGFYCHSTVILLINFLFLLNYFIFSQKINK